VGSSTLAAIMGHATPPDASGKKRNPKPKTNAKNRGHKITKGEKSMVQPHQQHGELATGDAPKPLTDRQMTKEHAKHAMRRATADWVEGRISSKEHKATHERARHVISGKHPHEFKGRTGERKTRGL
jgi:hypothetical protein